MKIIKTKKIWVIAGRTKEWSVGFNIAKRSIDFSLLVFWICVELT